MTDFHSVLTRLGPENEHLNLCVPSSGDVQSWSNASGLVPINALVLTCINQRNISSGSTGGLPPSSIRTELLFGYTP